jgi:myo-inositol catabolism protein IolC
MDLGDIIKDDIEKSSQNKVKAMIFLHPHGDEELKIELSHNQRSLYSLTKIKREI